MAHFPLKYSAMKMIRIKKLPIINILLLLFISGCIPVPSNSSIINSQVTEILPTQIIVTPLPTRPNYSPGEIVTYTVQTGDTLTSLAAHFNTSEEKILSENSIIPDNSTTLPPGLPMSIPITFRSFWGSAFQILPDEYFINGPTAIPFSTKDFIQQHPGWLNGYREYAGNETRSAASIIDFIAQNFSVSPMVLITLIEYQSGGLSIPENTNANNSFVLGYKNEDYRGLFLQLVWAANQLNQGYYGWRSGELIEFTMLSGNLQRPDPWQNSATIAFHLLFSKILDQAEFNQAVEGNGIFQTFNTLFGDLWNSPAPHIPGSLKQPEFTLPFEGGITWSYTGGPHTGWGEGPPLAALDFAPPAEISGCFQSSDWVTAIADGIILRTDENGVILDTDGDGDERTGWVIFYLHMSAYERIESGVVVITGDYLGHPSCEGGSATGSHVHIARKFNGEWIIADSTLPFVLEGWQAHAGNEIYLGTLERNGLIVEACTCSSSQTFISAKIIENTINP